MTNNDVLTGIAQKDIKEFNRDFSQLLKVGSEIDRYYGEWKQDIDKYFLKFEKLSKKFNKKYKNIKIKIKKKIDGIHLGIFLDEKSIKDLFNNCASRITGLKSIGVKNFGIADINEAEKFANEVNKIKNELYLTYMVPETGSFSVYLSKRNKSIELNWDVKESILELSPDFKICAYYALKDGYGKKIKILEESATFGFLKEPSQKEVKDWFDKLNPRALE